MKSELTASVRAQEGPWYEGPIQWLRATSPEGSFEVWPGHAPLIAALKEGPLTLQTPTGPKERLIKQGFLQVEANQVLVLIVA
jgi:F0F1-type ATP synthase epsilon subunit